MKQFDTCTSSSVSSTPRALDMINVMSYDFHGSWDPFTGECSPLYKGPADKGGFIDFNVVSRTKMFCSYAVTLIYIHMDIP